MILKLLEELGVNLTTPCTLAIFGPSQVGKSLITLKLASEINNGIIYAIEPQYKNPDFYKLVTSIIRGRDVKIERVWSIRGLIKKFKSIDKASIIVVDSISALIDYEASRLIEKFGIEDISFLASRLNPLSRIVSQTLNITCNRLNSIGVLIVHATSTAGRGLYRNLIPYKPSFASRCEHYLTYELFINFTNNQDKRIIQVITSRPNHSIIGKKLEFSLSKVIK
mgnify:CR=1 FL=1